MLALWDSSYFNIRKRHSYEVWAWIRGWVTFLPFLKLAFMHNCSTYYMYYVAYCYLYTTLNILEKMKNLSLLFLLQYPRTSFNALILIHYKTRSRIARAEKICMYMHADTRSTYDYALHAARCLWGREEGCRLSKQCCGSGMIFFRSGTNFSHSFGYCKNVFYSNSFVFPSCECVRLYITTRCKLFRGIFLHTFLQKNYPEKFYISS